MSIPSALLSAFPASNVRLLDVARCEMDDAMLQTIAEADYGIDAKDHLAELRSIRDKGLLPVTLRSGEVLTLTMFSESKDVDREPSGTGVRADRMLTFACAVLLRGEFEGCGRGTAETALARCLISARLLGDEMNRAIGSFLTWAIPLAEDADRWLFKLGLLIVVGRVLGEPFAEPVIGEVAAWVLSEEGGLRSTAFEQPPAPFGLQQGFWNSLAAELIGRAATTQTKAVRDDLDLIGQFVLGTL